MRSQRLTAHDRATLDRIVRPAEAVAPLVQVYLEEFLHSDLVHRYIQRVVHEELERLAEEDERC